MADVTVLYNGQSMLELNDSGYASIYRSISIEFSLRAHRVKRIID